jgi:hypothetical protein
LRAIRAVKARVYPEFTESFRGKCFAGASSAAFAIRVAVAEVYVTQKPARFAFSWLSQVWLKFFFHESLR